MAVTARRLTIAAVLSILAFAAPAYAGQIVYPSGTGIWVMDEDGSAARELVDVSQVQSMEHPGDPSIQPNATEVPSTAAGTAGCDELRPRGVTSYARE